MPNLSTTAALTGVIYYGNGKPASGKSIIIKRVTDASGNLISSDHTIKKTGADGSFNLTVPQNSYVWVYADIDSYNGYNGGSPVYIGTDATYELRTLTADISYPEQIPVAIAGGGGGGGGQGQSGFSGYSGKSGYSGASYSASLTGYSPIDHTHTQYATSASLTGYSSTNHTHSQYATSASLTGYIAASASGSFSTSGHTHNQYATTASLGAYLPTSAYNADHRYVSVLSQLTSTDTVVTSMIDNQFTPYETYHYMIVVTTSCTNIDMYHIAKFDVTAVCDNAGTLTLISVDPIMEYKNYATVVEITNNSVELQINLQGILDTDIYWFVHMCKIS